MANLLTSIAFVALVIGAARNADWFWASVAFTFAVVSIAIAFAGAICDRHRRRYWTVFFVFGFCYLTLVFGPWFSSNTRPKLLSSVAIARLHRSVSRLRAPEAAAATVYLASDGKVYVNAEEIEPAEIADRLGNTPRESVYVYEDDPTEAFQRPGYQERRGEYWDALGKAKYHSQLTADSATALFPRREDFEVVCHSFIGSICGLFGYWLARCLHRKSNKVGEVPENAPANAATIL
ncbi:hypothetical protein Pla100_62990 [Neorhodopirellula pilleata]|uniref:Uncharacterized protein n=1 Tax=Neorhodopirellula pilleata TaxID=2714738 RepID=A0A5C5YVE4_9BACT|nr:hypothetical protein Pla100_62990 [Neorhodopirellula pilleata]